MSIAWTTILVVTLLLPGAFFFIGYSTRERYSREIVRSSVIGDLSWAILISIFIHLFSWMVLWIFGFDLASFIKPLADFQRLEPWHITDLVIAKILPLSLYIVATAFLGLGLGWLVALGITNGLWLLKWLATHKWVNEIIRSSKKGLITVYVMTNTTVNDKVLMYKGVFFEFYLSPEGKLVYIVLKQCSRYHMKFDQEAPTTGDQLHLFGAGQAERPSNVWDYLLIDGANIANVLFDSSKQILETEEGSKALDKEVAAIRDLVTRTIPPQSN